MTTISVICVSPDEAKAAHVTAQAMASHGVALLVFSKESEMEYWIDSVQTIPGLFVRRLQASEVLYPRQPPEFDQQALQ